MRRVASRTRPKRLRTLAIAVAALAMFAIPAAAHADYEEASPIALPSEMTGMVLGISMDSVNGYFYVSATGYGGGGSNAVYRFDRDGEPIGAFGSGLGPWNTVVNPTNGDVSVLSGSVITSPAAVSRFSSEGEAIGSSWTSNDFVMMASQKSAVSADGVLHIPNNIMGNSVSRYSSDGDVLDPITGEGSNELVAPAAVGIDSSGLVYVLDHSNMTEATPGGRIQTFDSDGEFVSLITEAPEGSRFQSIAVHPGTGDIWVMEFQNVEEDPKPYIVRYEDDGTEYVRADEFELVGSTTPMSFLYAVQIAVDELTGKVYVLIPTDREVKVFADPQPPVAESGAASGITQTKATVSGQVNPQGSEATCAFLYGKADGPLNGEVPCKTSPGAGYHPVSVSADLTGLSGDTEYRFQLVAENDVDSSEGSVNSFKTLAHTCETDSSLCPPPDPTPPTPPVPPVAAPPAPAPVPKGNNAAAVQKCVKSANNAHKKAVKAANKKKGKAKANAKKAANKKKQKAVAKCKRK